MALGSSGTCAASAKSSKNSKSSSPTRKSESCRTSRRLRAATDSRFSSQGEETRIDHEREMRPKGVFLLFAPMMGLIGRKNLRDTANALQARLER
jgi:hypothetical protein